VTSTAAQVHYCHVTSVVCSCKDVAFRVNIRNWK